MEKYRNLRATEGESIFNSFDQHNYVSKGIVITLHLFISFSHFNLISETSYLIKIKLGKNVQMILIKIYCLVLIWHLTAVMVRYKTLLNIGPRSNILESLYKLCILILIIIHQFFRPSCSSYLFSLYNNV